MVMICTFNPSDVILNPPVTTKPSLIVIPCVVIIRPWFSIVNPPAMVMVMVRDGVRVRVWIRVLVNQSNL